jgi:uncharacterized protein (DUF2147 family)
MRAATITSVFLIAFCLKSPAQKNQIEKSWYDEGKTSKVLIYRGGNGKFYGKIVWLKEPVDKATGKPQKDDENPDPKLRSNPVIDLVILKDFVPDPEDKNVYTGGNIYDPDSGKTWCGKITFKGNKLDLRGFLCSFSVIGKTETWTEAN